MYSDPVSRLMLDAPHPLTRDHSSNVLALGSSRLQNSARTKPIVMVAELRGRDTPWNGSVEHISERIDEQVVDPWESKDQAVQSTVEQIHDAPVPEMVEQLVKLPKTVPRRNPDSAVQTIMEVPLLQSINKVVDSPVAVQRKVHVNQNVQKTVEDIQLQYTDGMVDAPVVLVVQIPQVQVVAETIEIPRLRIDDKIIDTPEFNTGTGKNPFCIGEGFDHRIDQPVAEGSARCLPHLRYQMQGRM